jgi:heterodisulfide reductase subunit B
MASQARCLLFRTPTMVAIQLDHSDGRFSTCVLNEDEVAQLEAQGIEIVHLQEGVYEAYLRHCQQDGVWQTFWQALSNEQYMRRRERELRPLEEASREIARLQEELAGAKCLETFYEARYAEQLHAAHQAEYNTYTCVYPQPGCEIGVLPSKWQESAKEILERFKADPECSRYQGCCCGHEHARLDAAAMQQLRAAGFLVENDTEVDP